MEKFQELKGVAWQISKVPPKDLNDGWKFFEMDLSFRGDKEQKWFIYDPTRIEIDYLLLDNISKDDPDAEFRKKKINEVNRKYRSWTQVDDDNFARPYLREIGLPLEEGFHLGIESSLEDDSKLVDFIQKGTLKIDLKRIPLNIFNYIEDYLPDGSDTAKKIIDDPDNVLVMDRMRADDISLKQKTKAIIPLSVEEFSGKNPEFIKKYSKPSFKKETFDILKQLRSLGYKVILSTPADERRCRVYLKLGMKRIIVKDTGDFLYYDLDNLEDQMYMQAKIFLRVNWKGNY